MNLGNTIYSFLWRVIKPYKWYYVLMLLAPLGSGFYELACSYSLKLVIDTFGNSSYLRYLDFIYPIALFIGAQILMEVFWRISNFAEWRSEPYVRRNIILQSYDYVQHHSYKFFQENYTGSVISKLKGIIDGYDNFCEDIHHRLAPSIATTVILVVALSIVSLEVCLFMTLWCIILFVVFYHMSKKLDLISFEQTQSKHKIFGFISDNLTNIFSLLSFANRRLEYNKIDEFLVKDNIPKQIRSYKYNFKLQVIAAIFYILMLFSIFTFMIYLRNENRVSSGDLVFVITNTLAISRRLWDSIVNVQDFIKHLGDFKSSFTILTQPQNSIDKPDAIELKIRNSAIKFENLSFKYDSGHEVFNNLSLNIKSGEKFGIVGLSGAGKSTLVSLLLKYFKIDAGKITIGAQDINEITSDSVRSAISLIPQDIMLFHRTIMDNIRYGKPDASDKEVIEAAKKANIHQFVEAMPEKYETLVGERGVKLSGGQRQRIAIARAILKNSKILILDEATSNLDTETEHLIQASINHMLDGTGATVIAIAHRLSTLKHMDRIIVLDKGKIVEEGTHTKLISSKNSLYKKLWELQKI